MIHPAHPDYHHPFLRHGVVFDPTVMTILSVVSTVASAAGSIMSGNAARGEANFEAAQMKQNAGQEQAVSQRKAVDARRQAGLANSAVTARAAASGAGATDPTVINIEGDNAAVGEYNALSALYQGNEAARQDLMGATAKRYEGSQTRQANLFKAGGTLMSDGSSLYDKYSGGKLPWLEAGNARPEWAGGGYY